MADLRAQLETGLASRYTIERELGQGGMATVYLAQDLRHDRKVALKVLRPELAAVIGPERFLAEIKTTANLQHPHILALFDSGQVAAGDRSEGGPTAVYYVMPFIEGESLRGRLDREKQLPVSEAIRISGEVASALDYAHRHGVIHRDIKPENILMHDGRALVADFGIALAASRAGGGSRMTETGMSLGTPHYMSPEQAMGEREITARADVYALGCVTYEMLVGEPPFTGPTAQAVIARVMTEEPRSLILQRRSVPPHVEDAVLTALEKLPPDRFGSTTEFAAALADPVLASRASSHRAAAFARPMPTRRPLYGLAAVAALAVLAALAGWLRRSPEPPVSRQRVALWRHAFGSIISPGIDRLANQAAIAPDGSAVVFADSVGGTTQLFFKRRDQSEPVTLAGTEHGVSPFFSPDGAWIGYLTLGGALKKVSAGGGGSITLAENLGPIYLAGAWLDDGTIVYVQGGTEVYRIPAGGGSPIRVLSDSAGHRNLVTVLGPLPGSRGFLFTTCPGNCVTGSTVHVFDFAADSARQLVTAAAGAWYSPTGHILYTDRLGGLYAVGFDPKRLTLTAAAVPVLDDVLPASFAFSASGSALYMPAAGRGGGAQLVWVSRDGTAESVDSTWRGEFDYPAVSPDGASIAVALREGATHLWVRRADGTRQKLTEDGTVNWRPSWTPDGSALAFASNRSGGASQDDMMLYQVPAEGGPPQLLQRHLYGLWEAELSRDGEWLVMRSDELGSVAVIRARRLRGDTTLRLLSGGRGGTSQQAALSPDGRWLAYTGTATGQREIYLLPFPAGGASRLVSRDGGTEPRWARSGRELYYKSGGQLVAVPVSPGPPLQVGVPRALFSVAGYRGARNRQQYDVAPGDQRFLMIRNPETGARAEAIYVEHWLTELRGKLQAAP